MRPTKPVDIYIRVSRVGGRENLISPDEQERRSRELARERDLTVGKVLTDLDESGGKLERPGLQEALVRVETGESGGVIVAWLDRLSRDSEHAHSLIRRITEAGGAIYAPDAPADLTTPEGELQVGIVFAFAQYVRKRAGAGFESAKKRAIDQGIPVHNRPPVGYRKREDRRLQPDPVIAPLIGEVFERRAAGEGPSSLADFLESHCVKTSQGGTSWSKQAIQCLIRSRVYLGEVSYGKDRRYVNAKAHEPIVDLATWTAAQHPNGRRLQPKRNGSRFNLTGLVRCQACGHAMQATTTSRGKRIYRCARRHAGGICPRPARISAELLEMWSTAMLFDVTKLVEARGEEQPPDLRDLENAVEVAERRFAQAQTPEMQDAAGHDWAGIVKERREERDHALAVLGEARAKAAHPSRKFDGVRVQELWPKLTAAEQREFFADVLDCVVIERGDDDTYIAFIPSGFGPKLSRGGYRREPQLQPIDLDEIRSRLPEHGYVWDEPLWDGREALRRTLSDRLPGTKVQAGWRSELEAALQEARKAVERLEAAD